MIASSIIDDEGRSWALHDPLLKASLATDLDPIELFEFCIRNMGFIGVRQSRAGLIITANPRLASGYAVPGLFYWLAETAYSGRIGLQICGQPVEFLRNVAALQRRLESMLANRPPSSRFAVTELPLDALADAEPVGAIFKLWRENARRQSADIAAFCDQGFNGRFTIARELPSGEFLIGAMGSGYLSYDANYVRRSGGTLLSEDPDRSYGEWVSDAHRAVVTRRVPCAADVRASIKPSRSTSKTVTYRRVIAPFTDPLTGPFVVSASTLIPGEAVEFG